MVECGYNTSHHDARLKRLEIACFLMHSTMLLFTIAYYELNYDKQNVDYQYYLLYSMQAISVYLVITTTVRYHFDLKLLKMRFKLSEQETLWSCHKRNALILECVICLLHPSYFLHGRRGVTKTRP